MFLLGITLALGGCAMSYQEPPYAVLHRSGGVEYRQYEPYLIAETVVAGSEDFDSAGTEGFRRLFKYITGANTGQAKIAMTVPVSQAAPSEKIAMTVPVQQVNSASGWRIAFMLPKQYTPDNAPAPTDSRVRVVAIPGKLTAVLRYSGRWTESNFLTKRDELVRILAAAGIKQLTEPRLARYNAPFSLPFLRRNEVLIDVNKVPDQASDPASPSAMPSGR
ncbi:MAG: heme-binding protein [Gammaproteobacteria bacterium]